MPRPGSRAIALMPGSHPWRLRCCPRPQGGWPERSTFSAFNSCCAALEHGWIAMRSWPAGSAGGPKGDAVHLTQQLEIGGQRVQ